MATTYLIKWELKNYDNLEENVRKANAKFHYDYNLRKGELKVYKSKAAAERQVAKYKALDNDAWEITVVENI